MLRKPIRSRVWSHFRRLKDFAFADHADADVTHLGDSLRKNEVCYGVYRNHPDSLVEAVFVTNRALHVARPTGGFELIEYSEIRQMPSPENKREAEELEIVLGDDRVVFLPARRAGERSSDVFSFMSFLIDVRGILGKYAAAREANPDLRLHPL